MNATHKTIENIVDTNIVSIEDASGTCLQGYIYATRAELTKVFGKPGDGDGGYKFFHDWAVEIELSTGTGHIATIYDWKYDQVFPEDIYMEWNIGGNDRKAVDAVAMALTDHLGLEMGYLKTRYAR
jgi:hypothetical protein